MVASGGVEQRRQGARGEAVEASSPPWVRSGRWPGGSSSTAGKKRQFIRRGFCGEGSLKLCGESDP